jgi:acetyltransferase-like isoleucine patch superfamily enzyme
VNVAQGARQHGIARSGIPMTRQPGEPVQVRIGNDVWIGTGAVVLADVAEGTVVGAGAVVTRLHEPCWIIAGVPARPSRPRS